jgi:hypothetical protein
MSCNAILSLKLESPHRSIERGRKHSDDDGGGGDGGMSFLLLSLSLLLWQMGNTSTRGAKSRGVRGKKKTTRLKRGEAKQFDDPTTCINCGHRNVSSRP